MDEGQGRSKHGGDIESEQGSFLQKDGGDVAAEHTRGTAAPYGAITGRLGAMTSEVEYEPRRDGKRARMEATEVRRAAWVILGETAAVRWRRAHRPLTP